MNHTIPVLLQHLIGLMTGCDKNAPGYSQRLCRIKIMDGITDINTIFRIDLRFIHPFLSHRSLSAGKQIINAEDLTEIM